MQAKTILTWGEYVKRSSSKQILIISSVSFICKLLIQSSVIYGSILIYKHFTLGVEEEYMVIDPQTRELKSHEQKIVTEGQKIIKDKVKAEMHQAVVEVGTDICQDIEEAFRDVATLRQTISEIADDFGLWVGAQAPTPSAIGKAS